MKQEISNNVNNSIIPMNGGRYLYMSDYNQVINSCIEKIFIKHGSNRKISNQELDINEALFMKKVRKLPMMTFEITENCNLRCKYCVFSDHYTNWRNLSSCNMDFETAKNGIDYIFSLIKDRKQKEFFLCFYGGEPLLNFATIREVVDYGKRRFAGWKLDFVITTNLTLMDDEILDFLVRNNFSLMVSLDGCKENHDKKRVFANGKGTFDTIYRNLEKIAEKNKDYFKKIRFSAVYSPDLSFKKMYKFFTGNELIKDKWARFSLVNSCDTTYYEIYPFDRRKYQQELDDVFSQIIAKVRQGDELAELEVFMFNNFKGIGRKLTRRRYSFLSNACFFDSRLYLDARGRFHMCERINHNFPIGDVERGFDFQAMITTLKKYTHFIKTHCSDCNLRFLCSVCYIQFAGNGKFEFDSKFCDSQRRVIVSDLERYIQYKEEGLL